MAASSSSSTTAADSLSPEVLSGFFQACKTGATAALQSSLGHGVYASQLLKLVREQRTETELSSDRGGTAFHLVAAAGYKRSLSLLIDVLSNSERSLLLNSRRDGSDEEGLTPLMLAAAAGHTDCVTILMSCGALPDLTGGPLGQTALHMAASRYPRCCEVLVARGASTEIRDANGKTPLEVSSTRCAEVFLRGAGASSQQPIGRQPAVAAEEAGQGAAEVPREMMAVVGADSGAEGKADESSTVRIATFNILADAYTNPRFFPYCPSSARAWSFRFPNLVQQLRQLNADLLCLQEVDHFDDLCAQLSPLGYDAVWHQRPGRKPDGSAFFWQRSRLTLEGAMLPIDLNSIARDEHDRQNNVGMMARFALGARTFVVAHGHLHFRDQSLTALQTGHLRKRALAFAQPGEAVFLAGDWNCEPGSTAVNEAIGSGESSAIVLHDTYASVRNVPGRPLWTFFSQHRCAPDHLLFSNANARLLAILAPRVSATPLPNADGLSSDHIPLMAQFALFP